MKFDCGLNKKTKERLSNWHWKFAWFPIRVDTNDCRWLEYYERKGKYIRARFTDIGFDGYWEWEYKFKGNEDVV